MSISISTQIPNQKAAKKKKKNEISREQHSKQANIRQKQEKMRGQRGTLPVQALGYVNSTKVIYFRVAGNSGSAFPVTSASLHS